jgi:DNA polymerase type B, organellar and viral
MKPYLICFYDGHNFSSFYLSDYNSVKEMMLTALGSLLKRKYNGYTIYAHNMAKFDIIFLLKYLIKLGKINPIIHNGKIISLSINYGKNGEYKIEFKDSLLLLLGSLNLLCKSFKIEEGKSIFPHLFVNENNLNYNGDVPNINHFIKINKQEYKDYKSKYTNWSLKSEAIKYCKIDCISLYQIIFKFNEMIYNLFKLNIHNYPTLPSLAFAIFRSNFMTPNLIPQLSGKISRDIRSGYTGGAVDMYIPENPEGTEIFCYDVNSLYPSQMQSQLMPVGMPTYFKGNILKINPNAFGFFYCKIIAPENIKHPILQTRVKVNGIYKTIAPIGNWEDMIFSEEMKNAVKYGYKFEILWGYTFKS